MGHRSMGRCIHQQNVSEFEGEFGSLAQILEAATKTARLKTEITFLACDSEIRKMQLTKEITIAETEKKGINGALIDERKEIAIKQEPLNPSVSSFIPVSTLHHTRETAKTKPKVTPTHAQDNPDSLPTMVPVQTQQR